MNFLGVTEMTIERTWNVFAGEVYLAGMPQTHLAWHYPFGPRSFMSPTISVIMT